MYFMFMFMFNQTSNTITENRRNVTLVRACYEPHSSCPKHNRHCPWTEQSMRYSNFIRDIGKR